MVSWNFRKRYYFGTLKAIVKPWWLRNPGRPENPPMVLQIFFPSSTEFPCAWLWPSARWHGADFPRIRWKGQGCVKKCRDMQSKDEDLGFSRISRNIFVSCGFHPTENHGEFRECHGMDGPMDPWMPSMGNDGHWWTDLAKGFLRKRGQNKTKTLINGSIFPDGPQFTSTKPVGLRNLCIGGIGNRIYRIDGFDWRFRCFLTLWTLICNINQ